MRQMDKIKEDHKILMADRERMGGKETTEELKREFEELQKEYSQQEDVSTANFSLSQYDSLTLLFHRSMSLFPGRSGAQRGGLLLDRRTQTALCSQRRDDGGERL